MEREPLAVVRGGWLWTGSRLIARGGVQVEGDTVAALLGERDPDPPGAPVVDLPRALIHPGLLNAHAHLDLSGLEGAIPPGLPFGRWLSRLREERERRGA
ncbi:MAG: amidohydrolase family protein, partial [Thermoanaerobaculia bacterium]